jgi:uncharacterized protein DUF6527
VAESMKNPWWERFWQPTPTWQIVATVEAADEIPDRLPEMGIVVVGSREHPKWLVFDCPCNTGHRIMVTLDPANRPHWRITNRNKLSIYPSIDYRGSRMRCHYLIHRGRTVWVRDIDGDFYG